METKIKVAVVCLGLITSALLICLQPHVHPKIIPAQEGIRKGSHEFRKVWENLCFPNKNIDIFILVVDLVFLAVVWTLLFRFLPEDRLLLTSGFGISFVLIHMLWYAIYKDGFIPLNSLVSAALFMLIIYHSYPVSLSNGGGNEEYKKIFIEHSTVNMRHLITLMLTIAMAIGASVIATSFAYMAEMFKPDRGEMYKRALFLARKSVVSIAIWNLLLFLFFLLPIMYGKVNRLIDLAKE